MMQTVSYQLYSSRKFPPVGDTLAMLADLGYAGVEGYGGLFETPDAVAALSAALAANGLVMPTAHIALETLERDPERVLSLARDLGLETVVIPYLAQPDRPADTAGWTALGARVARAAAPFRRAGLSVAWHNHDFELHPLADGSFPLDHLLRADPELSSELDLAWVRVAGQSPVGWLDRLSDRVIAVHIKDIAPTGENRAEDGWADPGHGTMDWAAIVPAIRRSAVRHLIVEHDNPSDHRRFARRALATVRGFRGGDA